MADSSTKDRKQKAAEMRAAQLAAEKRKERMIRILGGAVVLIIVVGIIGLAVAQSRSNSSSQTLPDPNPSAALPTGVDPQTYGYVVGSATSGVPQVQVWEDFQCPACQSFEQSGAATALIAAAEAGEIGLQFRPAVFLDARLGNNSSLLATNAWGCAADAGKGVEYHSAVFANQPTSEGVGYNESQLVEIGQEVGISGDALPTFEQCVYNLNYAGWVANSQQAFSEGEVSGTPSIYVNGQELPNQGNLYFDPEALLRAITNAS